MSEAPEWDVAVVGAGPAGLSAAHAAAAAGRRVIVLERSAHPRYKTCGGGLIGTSLAVAGARIAVPAADVVRAATFSHDGRRRFTRRADEPLLTMVRREDFDDALRAAAVAAGAVVREQSAVRAVDSGDGVRLRLADGTAVRARVVVGADGSAGVTARHVGVRFAQVDLGLEVELPVSGAIRQRWSHRILVDWGRVPGSYGWVFPKGDLLTVGVIAERGRGEQTRAYLRRFLDRLGLAGLRPVHDSGHLTRCRAPGSPLRRGRVLVAGDAAGLLEPWTREGISFALRSGALAGEAAASGAVDPSGEVLDRYAARVLATLGEEMAAGRRLLAAFARRPGAFHAALATSPGWRTFVRFCRGERSMAAAVRHPAVRAALALAGGRPSRQARREEP